MRGLTQFGSSRTRRVAIELNNDQLRHFWDPEERGFYFTADDAEPLPIKRKEVYDGAIPSGNSVAMLNLLRLSRITGNTELEERAAAIGRAFSSTVSASPSAHTQLMTALYFGLGPSYEVVVVGDPEGEDTEAMLGALWGRFIPRASVLLNSWS